MRIIHGLVCGLAIAATPATAFAATPTEVEINAAVVEFHGRGLTGVTCVGEPGWIVCTGVPAEVCVSVRWEVYETTRCRKAF